MTSERIDGKMRITKERRKRRMKVERMIDEVIKKNGFEAEKTIWFCEKAELFMNFRIDEKELLWFFRIAIN